MRKFTRSILSRKFITGFLLGVVTLLATGFLQGFMGELGRDVATLISPEGDANLQGPLLDCGYDDKVVKNSFVVRNIGPTVIPKVWLEEQVYLVNDRNVLLGSGVPHVRFITNNGTTDSLFTLGKNQTHSVSLAPYQIEAFKSIVADMPQTLIVSHWSASCSFPDSKYKYRQEYYYVYNASENRFGTLEHFPGGREVMQRIAVASASPSIDEVGVSFIDKKLMVNPPIGYARFQDGTERRIYRDTRLTLVELSSLVEYCTEVKVRPTEGLRGTTSLSWVYENGEWYSLLKSSDEGISIHLLPKPSFELLSGDERVRFERDRSLVSLPNGFKAKIMVRIFKGNGNQYLFIERYPR